MESKQTTVECRLFNLIEGCNHQCWLIYEGSWNLSIIASIWIYMSFSQESKDNSYSVWIYVFFKESKGFWSPTESQFSREVGLVVVLFSYTFLLLCLFFSISSLGSVHLCVHIYNPLRVSYVRISLHTLILQAVKIKISLSKYI